ncbi:MAG: hypothetical protein D6768_13620, partial [Chloroflexi bacterium]
MSFAQRRPLPPPEAGQSLFAGRDTEVALYRLHFHRPKDNPQVKLITAISGPGGVGKSRLLDELEWYRAAGTVFSRIDAAAGGHDAAALLRAVADGLHRQGEPIPTPQFDRQFSRRQELLEQALTRSSDTKAVLRHFCRPVLPGVDAPAFTPDPALPAQLRWKPDDVALAFENPLGLLTQALVEDFNRIASATDNGENSAGSPGQKIVLIFDNFDHPGAAAGEWLLTHLLGHARNAIECDLRLVLAGRTPPAQLDERWQTQWDDLILHLPLHP